MISQKVDFEKINVSKEKYKLVKENENGNNLIFKFKEKLSETFTKYDIKKSSSKEFKNFIKKFINNKYSILKKNDSEIPLFFKIFQNEYKNNANSKSFFIKLFKEYINLRKNLLKYIEDNYGLLSFSFMFTILSEKNDKINNSMKNKNNNKNNEEYIIQGINNKSTNESSPPVINPSKKVIKPTLLPKIREFDLLYESLIDKQTCKDNHLKNINIIYKDLFKSIDNFVGGDKEYNLFNVITNNLDVDLNVLKLIFNFVELNLYNKAVDIHYSIKEIIYKKINNFEINYDEYIYWYNIFMKYTNKLSDDEEQSNMSDFHTFYDNIINSLKITQLVAP